MKKMVAATLVASTVALLFASGPAVSAAPDEPGRMDCDMTASLDLAAQDVHWIGAVAGCDIEGVMEVFETPANFLPGQTEHFFETFIITTDSGVISGVDNGVWGFNTLKFRANGLITQATGSWSYLVGYKLHESGYTSAFPPTEGTIVTLSGAMFLVAP